MATSNAINLTATGIAAYDGAGTFSGRTITAGTGISVTNGSGTAGNPTISAVGGGVTWTVVTGTTQAAAVNSGYIANNAGQVTVSLPTTSAVGDMLRVTGINNATGWKIAYTTGQQIFFGSTSTTITTGTLVSSATRDAVELVCIVANTTWQVLSSIGNLTVT